MVNKTLDKELLRYGNFIDNKEVVDTDGNFYRMRTIKLKDKVYYHKMLNGETVEICEIG